ncbi:MAG: hypothetical protein ABIN36_00335 [Ferruginibacter sp.]
MKTILFAIQALFIIALLPVCAVLELNHGTRTTVQLEAPQQTVEIMENPGLDLDASIISYPITAISFRQGTVKPKKKSSDKCCSCKDCACGNSCKCAEF